MFLFIREWKLSPRKSQQFNEPTALKMEIFEEAEVERGRFTLLKVLTVGGNVHKPSPILHLNISSFHNSKSNCIFLMVQDSIRNIHICCKFLIVCIKMTFIEYHLCFR